MLNVNEVIAMFSPRTVTYREDSSMLNSYHCFIVDYDHPQDPRKSFTVEVDLLTDGNIIAQVKALSKHSVRPGQMQWVKYEIEHYLKYKEDRLGRRYKWEVGSRKIGCELFVVLSSPRLTDEETPEAIRIAAEEIAGFFPQKIASLVQYLEF